MVAETMHRARFSLRNLDTARYQAIVKEQLQGARLELGSAEEIDAAVLALQKIIKDALETCCPRGRPSPLAQRTWSPDCIALLKEHRQARRWYTATGLQEDEARHKRLRNQLKAQIRKDTTTAWREFVTEATSAAKKNGLWRLAKRARRDAGRAKAPPQLPPLTATVHSPLVEDNQAKTETVAAKFFPLPTQADLTDINTRDTTQEQRCLSIDADVSSECMEGTIRDLPNGKSPGPDGIPDEALKACRAEIAPVLAEIASKCLGTGYFPTPLSENNHSCSTEGWQGRLLAPGEL